MSILRDLFRSCCCCCWCWCCCSCSSIFNPSLAPFFSWKVQFVDFLVRRLLSNKTRLVHVEKQTTAQQEYNIGTVVLLCFAKTTQLIFVDKLKICQSGLLLLFYSVNSLSFFLGVFFTNRWFFAFFLKMEQKRQNVEHFKQFSSKICLQFLVLLRIN